MRNKNIALLLAVGIGAAAIYGQNNLATHPTLAATGHAMAAQARAGAGTTPPTASQPGLAAISSAAQTNRSVDTGAKNIAASSSSIPPTTRTAATLAAGTPPPPVPAFPPAAGAASRTEEASSAANPFQGLPTHTAAEQVFIKPADTILIADAAAAKALITSQGAGYFQLGSQDNVELKTTKRDSLGNDFYKFQQTYDGLPVAGRELVVQAGPEKQLAVLAGQFQSGIDIGTTPSLTAARALDLAMHGLEPVQAPNVIEQPKLAVYVDASSKSTLTYRTVVEFLGKQTGYRVDELYIDAHSGRVVYALPRLHTALARELFDFQKQCLTSASQLPGSSLPLTTTDTHAKSAYDNTGLSYWFYKNMFSRDSFDSKGITLRSTVHALFSTGSSCTGDNAMFSSAVNQIIFGEGGTALKNPAGALDIVAHELTHGVTANESNLAYQGESGAINEAVSDVFGAAAETWHDSGGSVAGNPASLNPTTANWTIGEKSATSTSYERFMFDPTADGHSKDYYPDRYTGQSDYGGVHINSGIMNLAFYLLSQGGAHPHKSNGVQVTGIGMKKALEIYYHSTTNLFTSSTNFQQARALLAQSAETLYGKCSAEWEAVEKSYDAVAVPGTWQACSGSGGTTPAPAPAPAPTPNLATGAIVSASSVYSASYAPGNVNDGNANTAWNSRAVFNPYMQEWVMLNLKSAKTLKNASIKWSANGMTMRFQVWAYQNGGWRMLTDQAGGSGSTSNINIGNLSAQYVVVTMIYGRYGGRYGIDEITLN